MSSVETPASDQLRDDIVDRLRGELGGSLVESIVKPGDDVWVRVENAAWQNTADVLRHKLGFSYFSFLSALDWMPSPYGKGEDDPTEPPPERSTEIKQGIAGGATRFQVFARVYDIRRHFGITVKADVDDADPRIDTWSNVYLGADWHERETWEMFGITFTGHPNLTHIYLPGHFEGFPLRKDFPLIARMVKPWPGIVDVEPMPGGDDSEGEA
ncbi:MAG: NADH-quinone oxidoreductase subunit C [Acidimicrobiia bacterium]